jgi:hypothetical protein
MSIKISRKRERSDSQSDTIKITELISILNLIKDKVGDLTLCQADKNMLSTLTLDNIKIKVVDADSYNFAINLNDKKYLSIDID